MPDAPIVVKLEGVEDAVAGLRDLRDWLPNNVIPGALRKAASWLTAEVQQAAPRRTGRLETDIILTTKRGGKKQSAAVAIRRNSFYWRFLELGWHRGGRFFQYPFIAPVVRPKFQQAAQIVIKAIGDAVKRAERRRARYIRDASRLGYVAAFGESFPRFW